MRNKPNKSIHIEDDIHLKLKEIQLNLKKVGIERTLHELNDTAYRYGGIDKVFDIITENMEIKQKRD